MAWPPIIPTASRLVLANAAVPGCLLEQSDTGAAADGEGLVRVDLVIDGGRIAAIGPTSDRSAVERLPQIDLRGNQVWPCFVDMHTHLDKGHIWPRAENADGTFNGALTAAAADRTARWDTA